MTTVILFVFGAIVGSFLNVVGIRFRSGLHLGGRSACASCAKQLEWWELLPIISFFLIRGRCSACKTKVSWQYPLIELWTGLLFATLPIFYWPIFCVYTVILIYDFRHKIIPDSLVYTSIVLAVCTRYLFFASTLSDWLVGPILCLLFALGWLVSRGRALGLGDAKLALSLGLLLGLANGLSAIALAFWIGAGLTLPFVLFGAKRITMKMEIPFAPFLIFGAWLSLLINADFFHVLSLT